ncbi:hypothetical protein M4A92_17485 [Caldibacillus thermoamylovorans]|jgi:hypothetical protein|uniref:hypothetical protein n=1 Tax=Bacillaceae TaxID=186817 RepID=UPI00203E9C0A|nr:hypothetical protein [Caldibacillus thermoamylovorans]MCM3800350.1 hypothetical protein [Caldibacillus thermoamylovorans]
MQDKVLKRNIESAGGWFVGEYAALILNKFNELESDKDFKNEFVREIFHNHGRDRDFGGTRTRVNAVIRIIKSNKIIEALEYVIHSDRINNEEPKAVEMAKIALREIKSQ